MKAAPPNRVVFTRQELHELVWSKPRTHLVNELGVSDAELAAVCRRHDIPLPPSGYWMRKAHGKAPPPKPLPAAGPEGDQVELIRRIGNDTTVEPSAPPAYDPDIQEFLRRASALPKIVVPKTLSNPSPMLESARKHFDAKEQWRRDDDLFRTTSITSKELIRVSRRHATRALCLMNTIIRTVEKLGGQVKDGGPKWGPRPHVYFAGEEVSGIRLRERYKQKHVAPTASSYSSVEYIPLGVFVLDGGTTRDVVFAADTETTAIEDELSQLMLRWIHDAWRRRVERLREAERQRREAEEAKRREEQRALRAQRRHELERRQREDQLIAQARNWQLARVVRRYIRAVERDAVRDGNPVTTEQLERWFQWATDQASRMDPLSPSPPSILDQQPERDVD